jgi:hypothetical protein
MSLSSRPKKVKPKGTVRELKLVQSVSRYGCNALIPEEVKTPGLPPQKASSTDPGQGSSSPAKRRKLENFDIEPVPFDLEGPEFSKKRQTLVFIFELE